MSWPHQYPPPIPKPPENKVKNALGLALLVPAYLLGAVGMLFFFCVWVGVAVDGVMGIIHGLLSHWWLALLFLLGLFIEPLSRLFKQ